ncbi:hypothetical protein Plhal304r1_c025g0085311 [Plasmopara halstedii]
MALLLCDLVSIIDIGAKRSDVTLHSLLPFDFRLSIIVSLVAGTFLIIMWASLTSISARL